MARRSYPKKRGLDDTCFHVQRGPTHVELCFSDLTEDEKWNALNGKSNTWVKCLCLHLAMKLAEVGELFEIEKN